MNNVNSDIVWRAQLAIATLPQFVETSVWGRGRERWKRTYSAIRAQCSNGNALFQWATRHNPYLA